MEQPPDDTLEEELLAETSARDLKVPELEETPIPLVELLSAVFDDDQES
jgi:hypothetical protein